MSVHFAQLQVMLKVDLLYIFTFVKWKKSKIMQKRYKNITQGINYVVKISLS